MVSGIKGGEHLVDVRCLDLQAHRGSLGYRDRGHPAGTVASRVAIRVDLSRLWPPYRVK
jgi:hypothetical protein